MFMEVIMSGDYTKIKENRFWNDFAEYSNDSYEGNLEKFFTFVNSNEFRTFGDGLLYVIQREHPELTQQKLSSIFDELRKTKRNIYVPSRTTLNYTWIRDGKRPDKGWKSRLTLYAIAIELGLSIESTVYLFQKVYLDRAFDFRNYKEIIFYYCINNSLGWDKANELISKVNIANRGYAINEVRYTSVIKGEIENIESELEILKYINENIKDLFDETELVEKANKKGKEIFYEETKKALKIAQDEYKRIYTDEYKNINGKKRKEIESLVREGTEMVNEKSVAFLFRMITRGYATPEKTVDNKIRGLLEKANFCAEIKNNFPEQESLREKSILYEELRKSLILVKSYVFWRKQKEESTVTFSFAEEYDFYDDYVEDINCMLEEAGFSGLYFGNPYDWLYLYSASTVQPIETFRAILAEVLDGNDEDLD